MSVTQNSNEVRRTAPLNSGWPAFVLAAFFLALGFLFWPAILQHFISLTWRRGHMLPVAYFCSTVCFVLAPILFFRHAWLNSLLHKTFPTRREFALAVLMLVFSVGLGAICMESLARVLNLPFHPRWEPSENPLARFDPAVGWSYIPNNTVTQEFGSDNRKVTMYFDDLACRVAKLGENPDRTAPTALFVGDSYTFGHGVPYEETFVGQLAARPDFPFKAVNLGVQAYGTDQTLLMLQRQFQKFNTKLVVYTYTSMQLGRNEVADRRIQYPEGRFIGTKPLFGLRRDGTLYLAERAQEFADDNSYSHLRAGLEVLRYRWGPVPSPRLTRALIQEMKNYTESHGAKFLVLDWYDDEDFPWGLDVDLIRVTRSAPAGFPDWVVPGDTHPDVRAHAYAANLIAARVKILTAQK